MALAGEHELGVYPMRDVVLVRGRGAKLWDETGREYIDCAAGVGVANIGHGNERVLSAITQQAGRLITCPGTFYSDVRAQLCARLVEIGPTSLRRVFLCNSGAEAVEAAIKFARLTTGKTDFVCASRGFHGRTFGALSATHNPKYRKDFEPVVPGFRFAPFNDVARFEAAVTDETAGIIVEVVQGEGGVHVGRLEFFRAIRELCDRRGLLLIVDEVQTGFCRTGRMFACMHHDLQPDIMCLAKSIAGGLPMGAVLCGPKIADMVGKHGSTFGGNPLCCAAALAAIGYMLDERLDLAAAEKGEYLLSALRELELSRIRDVRGLGLMIGIELREKVKPILLALLELGIIALPAGSTVLRLLPPLVIGQEEIDRVVDGLGQVLG